MRRTVRRWSRLHGMQAIQPLCFTLHVCSFRNISADHKHKHRLRDTVLLPAFQMKLSCLCMYQHLAPIILICADSGAGLSCRNHVAALCSHAATTPWQHDNPVPSEMTNGYCEPTPGAPFPIPSCLPCASQVRPVRVLPHSTDAHAILKVTHAWHVYPILSSMLQWDRLM